MSTTRVQRYYTPYEVAQHNTPRDCWVSFNGSVYDLTPLLKANSGAAAAPILSAAGTDISHWFDPITGDVRTWVDPETHLQVPFCPQGAFIHLAPADPRSDFDSSMEKPWWKDGSYRVGLLTSNLRCVRVKNTLTEQEDVLEVPGEETVGEIQHRYLALNAHAASYTWKALTRGRSRPSQLALGTEVHFRELDLNRTLSDNGVHDESEVLEALDMAADAHIPVLHVYWNDDLTVA